MNSPRWPALVSLLAMLLLVWSPQAQAKPACAPYCGEAECGPDGCGGSCGDCPDGMVCGAVGICDPVGCTDVCLLGSAGCEEQVAWTCEMGEDDCTVKVLTDCAPMGATCQSGICLGGAAGLPGTSGSGEGSSPEAADAFAGDAGSEGGAQSEGADGGGCSGGPTAPLWSLPVLLLWLRTRRRGAPGL